MKTVGRWPWKLAPAKKCVTTYLPNQEALKMDGDWALVLCATCKTFYVEHTLTRAIISTRGEPLSILHGREERYDVAEKVCSYLPLEPS